MTTPHALPPRSPLAIVSMACRLPGGSTLDDFWQLVRSGRSAIGQLPPDRLNQALHYDPDKGALGKTYSRIAGLVEPRRPVIPPLLDAGEAAAADPTHLTLLEVALEAISRAGWEPATLQHRKAGVFVGHTRGTTRSGDLICRRLIGETAGYLRELPLFHQLAGQRAEEVIGGIIGATRARYVAPRGTEAGSQEAHQAARLINLALGLDGPYMSMNSACASSLYALAAGAMALWTGEIELAIIGGASHCKVESLMLFSKAGSVSATGSRPFDATADGFVTAEGYVVVLLKTLHQAIADGDRIEAVIRGVGVSSDGKGKSLWAPRHEGQVEAIRRAYGDHLRPDRVQYLEAHATSTPVGDATEMEALRRGIGASFRAGQRAAVGSVKANIGHTLETAGLAGLVKTVLALQAREIPPTANVERPNPKIDWQHVPFDLPRQAAAWPSPDDGGPRRAGVNAFGIGGLNAHVVIDEYIASQVDHYFANELAHPGNAASDPAPPRAIAAAAGGTSRPHSGGTLHQEPIAIVGVGAILPGALTWDQFWQRNLQGDSRPVDVPAGRFRTDCLTAADGPLQGFYVQDYQYDWRKHKVPPKQVQQADPLQFMLLDAVDQALRHGGFSDKPFDRKRTGVIVGSIFGGEFGSQLQMGFRLQEFFSDLRDQLASCGVPAASLDSLCDAYAEHFLQRMPALIDETGSFTSSTLASRCTKTFDLMGGATAIDCGRCSGLAAVQLASWMLRSG